MSARRTLLIVVVACLGLVGGAAYATLDRVGSRQNQELPSPQEYIANVSGSVSLEQALPLADGKVTLAEYEAAIQRYLECGAARGLIPDPEPGAGLRPTRPGFKVPDADGVPDPETVSHARDVTESCRRQYLAELDAVWILQNVAAPEVARAALAQLTACMRANGVPGMQQSVTFRDIDRALAALQGSPSPAAEMWFRTYLECARAVEEETGHRLP